MLRTLRHNNGSSTVFQRQSETTTGRTTAWKSKATVDQPTLEPHPASTLDGGNSSDLMVLTLSMRKARYSMFMVDKMLKTETSSFGTDIRVLTNNGTSSMLMNTQMSQRKENSTKDLDSMLKDHSTLSLLWHHTDTLISSTTETWSSRHQMEETPKPGGSTKSH
jgi:hypothetical protein